MKKIFTMLICGSLILEITGCNNSLRKGDNDIHTFEGTIIECEKKSMIVRPNENEEEHKSSDKFRIEYVDGFNSCKAGNKVIITYKGMINESYPAQVGTTKIELKENNNVLKMKVLLDNKNFEVKNQENIEYIYQKLSDLEYEPTKDQSLENAILIYFYDQDDNMITMFAIYENYLKLNGMPDTYKIIDSNFNYNDFVNEIRNLL